MVNYQIKFDDTRVMRKLRQIENIHTKMAQPMQEAVNLLKEDAQNQPRKAPGAFSRLATGGQRRAYWAKVRSGEAAHSESSGYIRSGRLRRGWGVRVQRLSTGVRGEVYNQTPGNYGWWVHGPGNYRQPFHEVSGFKTTEQMLERRRKTIDAMFQRVINRELSK